MKMKKLASAALAMTMVASMALTGCGGSGGDSNGGGGGTSGGGGGGTADKLEVVIWDNAQQKGIQQMCDLWTEQSGIKVDVVVKEWGSYWTLLEAGVSGGDVPDVFWMHSNNSQMYMKNGALLKLDDYIAKSDKIDMANYMPEITELYTYDGSTYAIPKDYDTIALWYNKKMFDEAKIDYPDDTWTWDDMYEAAKKLTKKDGSQYGFAANPSNDQDTYYNMVYSMGGCIVTEDKKSGYDDPNTIKAMEYMGKLLKDCCPNSTTMSETGTDVMMQSGTVAMITQGSWMLSAFLDNEYMVENCDVAPLPYDKETGVRASICNGLGWAAFAGTEHPDDCWSLIEWLGSEEMQKKQAELGVTMSAYKDTSDAWVKSTDVFNIQPYLDQAAESTNSEVKNELVLRPYTYNSTVWSNAAQEKFVTAWQDPSKMADVCKSFAEEMNGYIAEENN